MVITSKKMILKDSMMNTEDDGRETPFEKGLRLTIAWYISGKQTRQAEQTR
jgi:dTDP-D-glucose 4,6-dehydratase